MNEQNASKDMPPGYSQPVANKDVPPVGDMPGLELSDPSEETPQSHQQERPALKQKLLDPLVEKPQIVQNMQGQVKRYIDQGGEGTVAQKLRSGGLLLLLLAGLALYGIGYLAARVYAFIGRIVLTPIAWLLDRVIFFVQAIFHNLLGFGIGVGIIIFALVMLNRQMPTFWYDLRSSLAGLKREAMIIGSEIPLFNEVISLLPGKNLFDDPPDFQNVKDLNAWIKRQELPLPPYVNTALSYIKNEESMRHYADLIKYGDIKRDGSNLEAYLYQDLFIQDERVRLEAWKALHAMDTPKAKRLIKEYEMTAKAYYKAKSQ